MSDLTDSKALNLIHKKWPKAKGCPNVIHTQTNRFDSHSIVHGQNGWQPLVMTYLLEPLTDGYTLVWAFYSEETNTLIINERSIIND